MKGVDLLSWKEDLIPHYSFVVDLVKDGAKFLIGAGAGWILKTARERWRTRHARAMWKSFLSSDLCIVLGRFQEFDDFERSGLLGVGDVIGLAELQYFLKEIGLPNVTVRYADEFKGDDLKRTIIAIGGPDANSVTRDSFKRFHSKFTFGYDNNNDATILDTVSEPPTIYCPGKIDSNHEGTDYGIILSGPNPFSTDKMLMIIAGCFGHGTLAGVRYATSREFLKVRSTHESKPFECLIKTEIVRDTPQTIHLIAARQIKSDKIKTMA